jgi:hypothetical protein
MKPSGRKLLLAGVGVAAVSYLACKEPPLRTGNLMAMPDDGAAQAQREADLAARDAGVRETGSAYDAGDAGSAKILGGADGLKTVPRDAGTADAGKRGPTQIKMGALPDEQPIIRGSVAPQRL